MSLASVAGLEVIQFQDDDFVDELVETISRLRENMEFYKIKGKEVYKSNITLKHILKIDNLITKRFKVNTKLVYGGTGVMAYFKIPPVIDSSIDENFDKVFTSLKKGRTEATNEKGNKVFNKRMLSDLSKNQEALLKYSKKNKITVDRDKAIIINMDMSIEHFIAMDWSVSYSDTLSDRELAAILLHEIGHMFTWIEYADKKIKNTTTLVEAFKNIRNPNEFRKRIDVAGKDLDIDMSKVKDKDKIMKVTTKLTEVNADNTHYYKDSEMLADQFATRFGLSVELASMLTKIDLKKKQLGNFIFYYYLVRIVIVAIFLAIATGGLAMSIFFVSYTLGLSLILNILIGSSIGIFFNQKTSKFSYDTLEDRIKRIKQDVIRQLAFVDDKDVKRIDFLLHQLEQIRSDVMYARNERALTEVISGIVFHGSTYSYTRMEKDLESLETNPLIVMKHKLKQLKG